MPPMSTNNERETHFQGFATLLYQELSNLDGHETVISTYRNKYDKQEIVTLIAQRAYDFARHVMSTVPPIDQDWPTVREWEWDIHDIPDLTAWPE